MKYQKVQLFNNSTLEIYLQENNEEINYDSRPAILIVPGGAYSFVSKREGEPIALRYMAEGFNCFVLTYSCKTTYPIPHKQVAFAFDYINRHADEFNVKVGKISIIGFSAGGHLAGSYSYLYKEFAQELNCTEEALKPFATVLSYPVIVAREHSHQESIKNITGGDSKLVDLLSIEKHVTKEYPPTFIWTTETDDCVDPINTYLMIEALKENKIKYMSLIYDHGLHGGALFNRATSDNNHMFLYDENNQGWISESARFLFTLYKC